MSSKVSYVVGLTFALVATVLGLGIVLVLVQIVKE